MMSLYNKISEHVVFLNNHCSGTVTYEVLGEEVGYTLFCNGF